MKLPRGRGGDAAALCYTGKPGNHFKLGASHAVITRQGLCNGAAAGDPAGSGGGCHCANSFHLTSRRLQRGAAEPGTLPLAPGDVAPPSSGATATGRGSKGPPPRRQRSPGQEPRVAQRPVQARYARGLLGAPPAGPLTCDVHTIISISSKSVDRLDMGPVAEMQIYGALAQT